MYIPESESTIRVKLLNTTTYLTGIAQVFVKPVVKGHEIFNFYDFAFLLEHDGLGKKAMFDLGTRKDYWNLPPAIQTVFGSDAVMTGIRVDSEVSEILEKGGVSLDSIDYCIWSHYHYDHCGNMSAFSPSTAIVVGAGMKEAQVLPGYPENPKSPVLASDFVNREIQFVEFTEDFKIGGFRAHDFFGDGSLYILDSPGHCPGHICALVRTTPSSSPDGSSFVFLGGDICHFAGAFRPSKAISMPETIPAAAVSHRADPNLRHGCPCSLFTTHHPNASNQKASLTEPWYQMADKFPTVYPDFEEASLSVSNMKELDGDRSIFVCLAHDAILLDILLVFDHQPNKDINNWREKGWKEACHWGWLNEVSVNEKPSHPALVDGFWRDGKPWDYDSFKKLDTQRRGAL